MTINEQLNKRKKIAIIIIIIPVFLILNYYFGSNSKGLNTRKVDYLNEIPDPKQTVADGGKVIAINKTKVNLKYLAEYEISGKVEDEYKYIKYKTSNQLGPMDVALSWGFVAKPENAGKVQYAMFGDRRVMFTCKDQVWLNSVLGLDNIALNVSNNHLIPANNKIEKLINRIEIGDYIYLKGYLVSATFTKGNASYEWTSSTSRTDHGDGACEVLYVTDIKWLEAK